MMKRKKIEKSPFSLFLLKKFFFLLSFSFIGGVGEIFFFCFRTSLQFIELKDFMQNCIEESINALRGISNEYYAEHLVWYEDCKMDDYFNEWTEIWDDEENEKVGEGLDTIAHKFVLNDNTRADFESAFEQARDAAFKAATKELAEEIEG